MSEILAWLAGTKLGRALIVLASLIAAGLAAFGAGWLKGKKAQATTDEAKDATEQAQAAQQVVQAATTRQEVEHETEQLPAAPAQTVATADPHTAAGQLRDDGWLRDDPGKD